MTILRKIAVFVLGGSAYVTLEMLWRGRSHISMFGAGGICLLLIGRLNELQPRMNLWARILAGAGIITAVELGTGLVANRDYSVWDYRQMRGNFRGQICPQFCLLWIPMSALALGLHSGLNRMLWAGRKSRPEKPGGYV